MKRNFVLTGLAMLAFVVLAQMPQTASAQLFQFDVTLDGTQSGTGSAGTGLATVLLNSGTGELFINSGSFTGLSGTSTNAHLHGLTATAGSGNAGVLIGLTFDSGVSDGTFSGSGTLSASDAAGVLEGRSYINLHSSTFAGGEIRGFLSDATAVPEPGSAAFIALSGFGLAMLRRRR